MSGGWVPLDAAWWPAIAESIGLPWPDEAASFDLRWHEDQRRNEGRVYFEERWGWSKHKVNCLRSAESWKRPTKDRTPTGRRPDADRTPQIGWRPTIVGNSDADRTPTGRRPDALLDQTSEDRRQIDRAGEDENEQPNPSHRVTGVVHRKPTSPEDVGELLHLEAEANGLLGPRDRNRSQAAIERALTTGRTREELEAMLLRAQGIPGLSRCLDFGWLLGDRAPSVRFREDFDRERAEAERRRPLDTRADPYSPEDREAIRAEMRRRQAEGDALEAERQRKLTGK